MSKYIKQLTLMMLAIITVTLAGCGGGGSSSGEATSPPAQTLWCKSPETINSAGTACELILTACNYPEVADDQGICAMDTNEWVPGSNGIDMPQPIYTAGANEVVLYYALTAGAYDGWGLHAWNNADCNSYNDFTRPEGGTDWTAPLLPTGIDPNFGAYWVMNIIESPNCVNFIPHNLDTDTQTTDLNVNLNAANNPTGSFYVLEGFETLIFPYPRTFDSLVVPGGSTLVCEAPLVLNEAGDACIEDAIALETFVPGEAILYLRGDFNAWEQQDAYAFSYADNIYTVVAHLEASADTYNFKIADANWSEPTSFGATATEGDIVLDEGKTLTVVEGENLKITVSTATNYQFTFDATDPEAPVLTVIEVAYDQVMYVKGSMNEWSNTQAMVYEGNGIYTSEYALDIAEYEFKVADANWTEATNFGAAEGDEVLELDAAKALVFGEGIAMNIKLNITEAANYRFTLDASVPEAPILTVSNAIPYGDKTLYLKGEMNEWGGELEGFDLTYADNHYTLISTVAAGTHQFKIADADWSDDATLGAVAGEEAVTLGEAKTLTLIDGANMTFEFAADTLYMIDVDATNKAAPVLTINEYVPFAGRTMYLKGEMNDWGGVLEGYTFTYAASGVFSLDVTLAVGTYGFKVADADWLDDSTMGSIGEDGVIVLGEAKTVTLPGDGNLSIDITEEKVYSFTLDASTPSAPVLTVVGL
ncbi:MAG: hypothetical protein ACI8WB_000173 [Phenylobacterium sp.]|jgi:hypothetical protein